MLDHTFAPDIPTAHMTAAKPMAPTRRAGTHRCPSDHWIRHHPVHYINEAAAELRDRLQDHCDDREVQRRATMVNIQAIFYFWHGNPL